MSAAPGGVSGGNRSSNKRLRVVAIHVAVSAAEAKAGETEVATSKPQVDALGVPVADTKNDKKFAW